MLCNVPARRVKEFNETEPFAIARLRKFVWIIALRSRNDGYEKLEYNIFST
jgi:beta-lactamase class A